MPARRRFERGSGRPSQQQRTLKGADKVPSGRLLALEAVHLRVTQAGPSLPLCVWQDQAEFEVPIWEEVVGGGDPVRDAQLTTLWTLRRRVDAVDGMVQGKEAEAEVRVCAPAGSLRSAPHPLSEQRMAREAEEATKRAATSQKEAQPVSGNGAGEGGCRSPQQKPAASPVAGAAAASAASFDHRHPRSVHRGSGPAPVTHAAPGSAAFVTEAERLRSHTRVEMARGLEERPAGTVRAVHALRRGPSLRHSPPHRAGSLWPQGTAKALREAGRRREMAERRIVRRAVSDVRAAWPVRGWGGCLTAAATHSSPVQQARREATTLRRSAAVANSRLDYMESAMAEEYVRSKKRQYRRGKVPLVDAEGRPMEDLVEVGGDGARRTSTAGAGGRRHLHWSHTKLWGP